MVKQERYEVVIVGGGPAGLSAAVYSGRALLKTVLIEKLQPGGQLLNTDIVEDYPGFRSIRGHELAKRMEEQARDFGAVIHSGTVTEIRSVDSEWLVRTQQGAEYRTPAVIYCPGGSPKKLQVPGEERLAKRGVSYCAVCDGPLFRGQPIAVVGGGEGAVGEAIYLARFGSKVYILDGDDKLEASPLLQQRAFANPKIQVHFCALVQEIGGVDRVEWIKIENAKDGSASKLDVGAVFVYMGLQPDSGLLRGKVQMDERGYIVTDWRTHTSASGIFAAGSVRAQTTRQIVNAAADGATAALQAYAYLEEGRILAPVAARGGGRTQTRQRKAA